MKNKKEELLADFLQGNISPKKQQELESFFAENEGLRTEFEDSKELFFMIDKSTEKEFDSSKDKAFYEFLSVEKAKIRMAEKPSVKIIRFYEDRYFKYVASVAVLLISFLLGRQSVDNQTYRDKTTQNNIPNIIEKIVKVPIIRVDTLYIAQRQATASKQPDIIREIGILKKEIQSTKDMMILSMLKRESPSERIQAVNYSYDLQRPNDEVLEALIHAIDYDRNINVRIAATDAIERFGNYSEVRDALIKSLLKQQEPTLQISLIEILTKYNEKRVLPALRLLADDDNVSDSVKQKAKESTDLLSI